MLRMSDFYLIGASLGNIRKGESHTIKPVF